MPPSSLSGLSSTTNASWTFTQVIDRRLTTSPIEPAGVTALESAPVLSGGGSSSVTLGSDPIVVQDMQQARPHPVQARRSRSPCSAGGGAPPR